MYRDGDFPVLLSPMYWRHDDPHVTPEECEEFHQPLDGKTAQSAAREIRDVRLRDTEDRSRLHLRELSLFNDRANLAGEFGFRQALFRIG